jgi:hypothetical protein
MTTLLVEDSNDAVRVSERDEVLTDPTNPNRPGVRHRKVGAQAGRDPVPAECRAHRRPRPDTTEVVVLFVTEHFASLLLLATPVMSRTYPARKLGDADRSLRQRIAERSLDDARHANVGSNICLLEDLAGHDEAEELVEPDRVQSRIAPDPTTSAPSDEVEEAGHQRASNALALKRRLGRHPPQSPRWRSALIGWLTDEGYHPDDRARGIESREVGTRSVTLEADVDNVLMRSENALPKSQHEKGRYLLDVDLHGR